MLSFLHMSSTLNYVVMIFTYAKMYLPICYWSNSRASYNILYLYILYVSMYVLSNDTLRHINPKYNLMNLNTVVEISVLYSYLFILL